MAKYLEGKDFDTIELCGLVSNICVLSNAVMAKSACPNSEIIVDSSLTAAADEEMHQKSLDVMKGLFIKSTLTEPVDKMSTAPKITSYDVIFEYFQRKNLKVPPKSKL